METNKHLPILRRFEGGLGGDDNLNDKQIRFRTVQQPNIIIKHCDDIIFDQIYNNWTYEELDDIIDSFVNVIHTLLHSPKHSCVGGSIELVAQSRHMEDNQVSR